MDISKFAKKPELIKMYIDDADIVAEYGDGITFYMMDAVDINTYFEFYRVQQEKNGNKLNDLMRSLILTADGKPALAADQMLPIDITMAVLVKINESLGKSKTKSLTPETGTV